MRIAFKRPRESYFYIKADGSFGIEVAKLAHIPQEVIKRAQEILQDMPENRVNLNFKQSLGEDQLTNRLPQSNSFKAANLAISKIKEIDFDNLTPKAAFDLLWQISQDL